MGHRKYKFAKPTNSQETSEAIYEELQSTTSDRKPLHLDTIKDILYSIHNKLSDIEYSRRHKDKDNSFLESVSLNTLGVISLLLLWNSSSTEEWIQPYTFTMLLIGMLGGVCFLVVSLERSALFKSVFKHSSAKILLAFIFSALLIYCTSLANTQINSVFHVDPSSFPLTRTILSGVFSLKSCFPVIFTLTGIFFVVHVLSIINFRYDNSSFPWASLFWILIWIAVSFFYFRVVYRTFSDKSLNVRTYELAHYLDFNKSAFCEDNTGQTYIFVGENQDKILIDSAYNPGNLVERLLTHDESGNTNVPADFLVIECKANTKQVKLPPIL